jgi:excisionase family DNA binding protein
LKDALLEALAEHLTRGGKRISIKQLIEGDIAPERFEERQREFLFSADDVLEETVSSVTELEEKYERVAERFFEARGKALTNTEYYLSMVNDLDVYVATSMRTREDFRHMASVCEKIFSDEQLKALNLRYFDPTLSAAAGHEDKGLIECLMVKCAKPPGGAVLLQRETIGQILGLAVPEAVRPLRDLTTDEVAEIFGIKPCTVLDWLHRGQFGAEGVGWYRMGRRYFIRRDAISNPLPSSAMRSTKPFALPRQPAVR